MVDALMASVSALVIAEPDSEPVLQTPVAALVSDLPEEPSVPGVCGCWLIDALHG